MHVLSLGQWFESSIALASRLEVRQLPNQQSEMSHMNSILARTSRHNCKAAPCINIYCIYIYIMCFSRSYRLVECFRRFPAIRPGAHRCELGSGGQCATGAGGTGLKLRRMEGWRCFRNTSVVGWGWKPRSNSQKRRQVESFSLCTLTRTTQTLPPTWTDTLYLCSQGIWILQKLTEQIQLLWGNDSGKDIKNMWSIYSTPSSNCLFGMGDAF